MREILCGVLLVIGGIFMMIAAIGLLRMPDLFMRMGSAAKAVTLGAACMLVGLAIYFGKFPVSTRAFATILFIYLTAPIAAHITGRTAYIVHVPLWKRTILDELKGQYDPETHHLKSLEVQTGSTSQETPPSTREA